MTGRRLSDEQLAERMQSRRDGWAISGSDFDAAAADLRAAREENQRLRQALEWTERNLHAAVAGKPVRDMAENLAANRALLSGGSSD